MLAAIVGREHVAGAGAERSAAAVDGILPRWRVRPGAVDEVSRILALASSEGLAVAPRGSGSALDLGMPPARVDVALDLSRLAGIMEYVPADMVATVQAGVRLDVLARELGKHGQMLPLDPYGGASRTVGGVLAAGASGPRRFRYGTGRDLLLGARFVQVDGTVTWAGAKVVKSVTGYEIPKLLVGSLGTLGVIVEATLWLHAAALARVGQEPSEAAVAISVASVAEAVASQGGALDALARSSGGRVVALDEEFWPGMNAILDAPIGVKLAGEIRRLSFWAGELQKLCAHHGLTAAVVGEAGNGVLRAGVTGSVLSQDWAREVVSPLRDGLAPEGGSLVVERAPVELKHAADVWGPVPEPALAVMKRLKAEFDPRGILNRGRFVGGL